MAKPTKKAKKRILSEEYIVVLNVQQPDGYWKEERTSVFLENKNEHDKADQIVFEKYEGKNYIHKVTIYV